MPKTCGIYKITSPSGKIYIGQSKDIARRMLKYKTGNVKAQTKIFNSIRKYGFDAHSVETIAVCAPEELDQLERFYIDIHNTFNTEHGLNLTDGGTNTGKYKVILADESRIKLKRSCRPETKEKLSRIKLGIKMSEKAKENMRRAVRRKGYKQKPGRIYPTWKVYCKHINGEITSFESAEECTKHIPVSVSGIRKSIQHTRLCKGYAFSYSADFSKQYRGSMVGKNQVKKKTVYVKDTHGKVSVYLSLMECEKNIKVARANIINAIHTKKLCKKKFYFSFKPFDL
jgi:group I intron endonuclease